MQPKATIRAIPARHMPNHFRDLAWRTFFRDRARGVSLEAHFPWLIDPAAQASVIAASINDAAAAMLVVRDGTVTIDAVRYTVAAFGLVCTDPVWRGQGLASTLIDKAIAKAATRADIALLWTRQTAFYERLGFSTADPMVTGIAVVPALPPTLLARREVRFEDSSMGKGAVFTGRRGIPPFVERIRVFEACAGDAAIAIGEVASGDLPVFLGWNGNPELVLDLIIGLDMAQIRWNGTDHDLLAIAAIRRGFALDLKPVGLAMWRALSGRAPPLTRLADMVVPLLDRF